MERAADGDLPLSVAFLAYRGKPHVGGQGVYTRHLTKALVDLGHHVEVLGGQPFPELDERVPLVELPSLDIYNDYFPMRMPGLWELKSFGRLGRGRWLLLRHLSRAAGLQRAGLAAPAPAGERVRPRAGQPVPRLRAARHRAARPAGARHHPSPDHRRPAPRDGTRRDGWQRFTKRRWYAFTKMQTRVASADDAGAHGVGELEQRHPHRPQRRRSTACTSCPSASTRTCSGPLPDVERVKGRLITTASADVTMKGLRYLLEAVAKLRTERHIELVVIGAEGGRPVGPHDRRARAARRRHVRDRRIRTSASSSCTPKPSWPSCRRSTKGSRCRPSRPCPAASRSSPPPAARCPRWSAPTARRPCWSPPGDSEALAATIRTALDDPELRARSVPPGANG